MGSLMELGEAITLAGVSVNAIGVTPYQGAIMAGVEVESRATAVYVSAADFAASAAALGSAVTFRSIAYTIGRIERFDAPLVRVELVR